MQLPSNLSVIIPTYNRFRLLQRTLNSIAKQTIHPDIFEVIVVDDGSEDATQKIINDEYCFSLKYLRQENQGATVARNNGALISKADILVFLDDDIEIHGNTLSVLYQEHKRLTKAIVVGTLIPNTSGFGSKIRDKPIFSGNPIDGVVPINFTESYTGLLSIRRNDFFDLDMFQDPTGGKGWPNWDDVDFGYRAYLAGYKILRSYMAIGIHWDHSLENLATASHRWRRASKSAVRLFQTHPELQTHLPMFFDKTPISWSQDSLKLIVRKLLRRIASTQLIISSMEKIVVIIEKIYPKPLLHRPLCRWVIGGYIFRGFRQGLREFGPIELNPERSP